MKSTRLVLAAALTSIAAGLWLAPPPAARAGDLAPSNSRQAMGQVIHELDVDGVAIVKVIDFLRNVSGANLVVNWKNLEAAGVTRETPITLRVKELTLSKMLQLVLSQASPNAPLAFNLDSNVIQITTQDDLDKQLITKVYVVDDLVMVTNNNVQAPKINLANIGNSGNSMSFGTGNGSNGGFNNNNNNNNGNNNNGLFGNSNGYNNNNGGNNNNNNSNGKNGGNNGQETPDQKGQDLVDLIKTVIRPNIWTDNGGPATIKYFNGKLIVTAPASVQEAIGGPVGDSGIRFGM